MFWKQILNTADDLTKEVNLQMRKMVSGDKIRHTQGGFNLDLTYITPRVIAMAYPASGAEKAIFNDADDVIRFLRRYHNNHFRIFNASERDHNYLGLHNCVKWVGWKDHHPPPMHHLLKIVQEIDDYLLNDPSSVAVVHCMAGRGRTGVIISSYFIYKNYFDDPMEAITYFNTKRSEGKSLSIPSQIQTVIDFRNFLVQYRSVVNGEMVFNIQPLENPKKLSLQKIVLASIPKIGGVLSEFRVTVDIYDYKGLLLGKANPIVSVTSKNKYTPDEAALTLVCPTDLTGDISCKFYHIKSVPGIGSSKIPLAHVRFHTSFIELFGNYSDFYVEDIDKPSDFDLTSKTFQSKTFRVRFLFKVEK